MVVGFCGTTIDFCNGFTVSSPQCDVSAKSSDARTIGYYEGWNSERECGNMVWRTTPTRNEYRR